MRVINTEANQLWERAILVGCAQTIAEGDPMDEIVFVAFSLLLCLSSRSSKFDDEFTCLFLDGLTT